MELLLSLPALTNQNFEFWDTQNLCFNYGWWKGVKGRWKRKLPIVFISLRALLLWWTLVPGWWGLAPWSVLQMHLHGRRDAVLHSFLPASAVQPGQDPSAFWGHDSWLLSFPRQGPFLMQMYKLGGKSSVWQVGDLEKGVLMCGNDVERWLNLSVYTCCPSLP